MFYPLCRVRLGGVSPQPLPAVRACAGEVVVPIVRDRVSPLLRPPALRRMSPACGSAGPVTVALRCHRHGLCREAVFPTAPKKLGGTDSAKHGAHSAGEASPVSPFQRQGSRARAWSLLPLCRGCCDNQSLQARQGLLQCGEYFLLAFLCFSSGV